MKRITKKTLWLLREEIVLNSLYTTDYQNTYGCTNESVQNFFFGYISYLEELMTEQGIADSDFYVKLSDYDCIDNLFSWYCCFETKPFVKEVV